MDGHDHPLELGSRRDSIGWDWDSFGRDLSRISPAPRVGSQLPHGAKHDIACTVGWDLSSETSSGISQMGPRVGSLRWDLEWDLTSASIDLLMYDSGG